MIEILSAEKIKIDPISRKEEFLVCEKRDGGILIMGLNKYLKLGRRRPAGRGVVIKKLSREKRER